MLVGISQGRGRQRCIFPFRRTGLLIWGEEEAQCPSGLSCAYKAIEIGNLEHSGKKKKGGVDNSEKLSFSVSR